MSKEGKKGIKVSLYNAEAEQRVLGACLHSEGAIFNALGVLSEEDFHKSTHKKIFTVMRELLENNEPIGTLALADRLRNKNTLDEVGGIEYLSLLEGFVPTSTAVTCQAKILRDKRILRDLTQDASEVSCSIDSKSDDVDTLLDKAEQSIFDIIEERTKQCFYKLPDIVKEGLSDLEKRSFNMAVNKGLSDLEEPSLKHRLITGLLSGYTNLDNMTAGFQQSDLIILAARPGMGKTSLALDIARNISLCEKIPTAFFSLKMSREQLGMRLVCSTAKVNSSRVRAGYLAISDWPKLHDAGRKLAEAKLFIDDSTALSVLDIRARANRLAVEQPLGLIIIDNIQLMQRRGSTSTESEQMEVSDISRGLKLLAKELNVPIIALSQLSHAVESRADKRPVLSDLMEFGSIEQDADVVMFLYRDVVYNSETDNPGHSEILIHKQGNDLIGKVFLHFEDQFPRFFETA